MGSIGCKQCKSPFHEEKDCPQTKTGESKFQFQSRKEMGLEPGSLPFKFRVEIDPEADSEVEVTRKRALLRLNSTKVYNLMGLSVKAHESQKTTLQWLIRLADELDIDDPALQKERSQLLPLIQTMQGTLQQLAQIQQVKIKQAEVMEATVTKARRKAGLVRTRIAKKADQKKEKEKDFWVLRLPDSNLDVPIALGENPLEILKEAADAILKKEKAKHPEPDLELDD